MIDKYGLLLLFLLLSFSLFNFATGFGHQFAELISQSSPYLYLFALVRIVYPRNFVVLSLLMVVSTLPILLLHPAQKDILQADLEWLYLVIFAILLVRQDEDRIL